MVKTTVGSIGDSFSVVSLKAYLAKFIATLLFVFASVGSAIAYRLNCTGEDNSMPMLTGLLAIALVHAFPLFVEVSMAANISGGHLNLVVTFGLAVGGHITVIAGIFYWIAQLLGSIASCFLLKFITDAKVIPTHGVASGVSVFGGVLFEIIITFGLVYTVYATVIVRIDAIKKTKRKTSTHKIYLVAIGFIVGANILAAGQFSGGSINPARSFGPAVASGNFDGNWIYWVGPFIGGGLAGLIYDDVFIGSYFALPATEDYA
ncbi:hypothetical protein MKX01_017487 [Papaver californicum]|nr:hypothetical protein MKX01_017487 [Papaver californicum]